MKVKIITEIEMPNDITDNPPGVVLNCALQGHYGLKIIKYEYETNRNS